MTEKCVLCKSTKNVVYNSTPGSRGAGHYRCFKCRTKEYQKGDHIIGIQWFKSDKRLRWDYFRVGYPVHDIWTLDDQLNEIRRVAEWVHKFAEGSFYHWHWDMKSASSFAFGHENSLDFLESHLEFLKRTVKVEPQVRIVQATLNDF